MDWSFSRAKNFLGILKKASDPRSLKKLLSFLPLSLLPTTIISCGDEVVLSEVEPESRSFYETDKQKIEQLNNEPIKYLAIGDSVSQGYMAIPFAASPGSFDGQEVKGASWPAFLADIINRIAPGKLVSFKNLSITGATVADWLYYLDGKNYPNHRISAMKKLETNQKISKQEFANFSDNLEYFQEFDGADFKLLKEEIKRANFITILLGGNSSIGFLISFLKNLFSLYKEQGFLNIRSADVNKLINDTIEQIDFFLTDWANSYSIFIDKVREINPDARVVILNYPYHPILALGDILGYLYKIEKNLMRELYFKIQAKIKGISQDKKLSFINLYSTDTQNELFERVTPFLDFHPTIRLHKWIAQQVFLKLAMPNKVFEEYLLGYNLKVRTNWLNSSDLDYISDDIGSFYKEIYIPSFAEDRITYYLKQRFEDHWSLEAHMSKFLFYNPKLPTFMNSFLKEASVANLRRFIEVARVYVKRLISIDGDSSAQVEPQANSLFRSRLQTLWNDFRKKPTYKRYLDEFKDIIEGFRVLFVGHFRIVTKSTASALAQIPDLLVDIISKPDFQRRFFFLIVKVKDIIFEFLAFLIKENLLLKSIPKDS